MTLQEQLLEVTKKHAKALALEIVEVVAFPALEKAVKDTETPIDDVVLASLEAPFKAQIKALIEKI